MGVYRGEVSCIHIYIQTGLYRALFSTTERKCRLQAEVTIKKCCFESSWQNSLWRHRVWYIHGCSQKVLGFLLDPNSEHFSVLFALLLMGFSAACLCRFFHLGGLPL